MNPLQFLARFALAALVFVLCIVIAAVVVAVTVQVVRNLVALIRGGGKGGER